MGNKLTTISDEDWVARLDDTFESSLSFIQKKGQETEQTKEAVQFVKEMLDRFKEDGIRKQQKYQTIQVEWKFLTRMLDRLNVEHHGELIDFGATGMGGRTSPWEPNMDDGYENFGHCIFSHYWTGWDPYCRNVKWDEADRKFPRTLASMLCNAENGQEAFESFFLNSQDYQCIELGSACCMNAEYLMTFHQERFFNCGPASTTFCLDSEYVKRADSKTDLLSNSVKNEFFRLVCVPTDLIEPLAAIVLSFLSPHVHWLDMLMCPVVAIRDNSDEDNENA